MLSRKPATLDIQYVKIDKKLRSDMIIFIIDHQHLLFIDLKKDMSPNNLLATYTANSNIILQFSSLFENLSNLSELREQSTKILWKMKFYYIIYTTIVTFQGMNDCNYHWSMRNNYRN